MRETRQFMKSLSSLGLECMEKKSVEESGSERTTYHFFHEGELWTVSSAKKRKIVHFYVARVFHPHFYRGKFSFKITTGDPLRPFARKLVEHLKSSKIRDILSA